MTTAILKNVQLSAMSFPSQTRLRRCGPQSPRSLLALGSSCCFLACGIVALRGTKQLSASHFPLYEFKLCITTNLSNRLLIRRSCIQPQLEEKETNTLQMIVVTIISIKFTSTTINEPYSCNMEQNILKFLRQINPASLFSTTQACHTFRDVVDILQQ